MDILKKPTQLETISWPVFKLGIRTPEFYEGVCYLTNEHVNQDNETTISTYIIDDKNINRSSLGLRRLQIEKDKLYPLNTVIYTLQDLIKIAKPKVWFIDNNGHAFQYKKTTRAKLQIYEINQVLPVSGIGCVLEIKGFSERFKSLTVPAATEKYAGILSYNGKNLLYGLYSTKTEPTWRLV